MAESGVPQEIKKYQTYALNVDPNQDDKATEIKLCNFSRPHMRAFHCSWWAFFVAFFIWFSIAPLLGEIKNDLKLTKEQIWTSNIVSVMGTIFMRFALGPACDKYGARVLFTIILCGCSIPAALTGVIQDAKDLIIIRLFIGLVGSCFVMCQFWSSRMFTKEVVGTANALVGGWGNLGGGITQIVMGSALFPLFKLFMTSEQAWRSVCIVPAAVGFLTGVAVYFISDDAPKGNYAEMKRNGTMPQVSAAASFRSGALNFNTWILFIQYGCCFGVELTMNNAAALYFREEFYQTTEAAAAIASIFGWMNLFARGLGGYMSDRLNAKCGMRGRLFTQFILLAIEGILVFVFSRSKTLVASIVTMVFFSIMVQGAEGSTYGIVPYVNPASTGSIAGIVGAGGNTGAVCFGIGFRQLSYQKAFDIMGASIVASSALSALIFIRGYSSIFCGEEETSTQATKGGKAADAGAIEIPIPDAEAAAEVNANE